MPNRLLVNEGYLEPRCNQMCVPSNPCYIKKNLNLLQYTGC
jgi:hypothetical protein